MNDSIRIHTLQDETESLRAELAATKLLYDQTYNANCKLRHERDDLRAELGQERANNVGLSSHLREANLDGQGLRTAARQDAEEKARLREALELIAQDQAANQEPTTLALIARAALACRPQGEK